MAEGSAGLQAGKLLGRTECEPLRVHECLAEGSAGLQAGKLLGRTE